MLEAIVGARTGLGEGARGEDQLRAPDAVDRDAPLARVRRRDRRAERLEARKGALVEDELHVCASDLRVRRRGKRDGAHHREPLGEGARSDRGLEQREGGGVGVGRRIGDPGDAGAREEASDGRQIGGSGRREPRAQPGIEAEEAARGATRGVALDARSVGPAIEPEALDRARVQHPKCTAAVLDAGRPVGDERIEADPVERACDRLVVADTAQKISGIGAERVRERGAIRDGGRAAGYGLERGSQGEEMDVVVVQPGKQGAALGVERGFTGARRDPFGDRLDSPLRDAHVAHVTLYLCAPDQHGMPSSARTAAVSAPRGRVRPVGSTARGADTAARAPPATTSKSEPRVSTHAPSRAEAEAQAVAGDVAQRELEQRSFARAQLGESRHRGM